MRTGRADATGFSRVASALLVIGIGGCLIGFLSACSASSAPAPAATQAITATTPEPTPDDLPLAPPTPVIDVPRADAGIASQPAAAAAPTRVRIEPLDIDMAVEPAGLDAAGSMALAANPDTASWYRFGPAPGTEGATVIAAHVDSLRFGLGPFARLADAPVGTEITIEAADGIEHRYAVESVQSTVKPEVPWSTIFDRTGAPRLTLVTCGGEFNYTTRQYQSNVVVTALPLP